MTFALYRALLIVCRDMVVTQGILVFYCLIIQLCSGYIIAYNNIPGYWIWYGSCSVHIVLLFIIAPGYRAYWLSPMAWGFQALAINEMTSSNVW